MSSSPTPEASSDSTFVCDCSYWSRAVCAAEPFYKEHEGKRYCVLHYSGTDKGAAFDEALRRKKDAEDFNFHGVHFPGYVSFTNFRINTRADFSYAVFNGTAHFLETFFNAGASFSHATFLAEAHFGATYFKYGVGFHEVNFDAGAIFRYVHFDMVSFNRATFSGEVDFTDAVFNSEADFNYAVFRDYVRFARESRREALGARPSLSFQHARFDKPERASFHTVALRPHWFINVDARKFDFTNVLWLGSIRDELKAVQENKVQSQYRLFARACRQLAVNEEENHRYEEASKLRYLAMDSRRLEWLDKLRGHGFLGIHYRALKRTSLRLYRSLKRDWGLRGRTIARLKRFSKVYWQSIDLLHWLYWAASGYGERAVQAFIVLICIWLLAALSYTQIGFARWEARRSNEKEAMTEQRDEVGEPLKLPRAFTYSLGVMTLQKPEPRPATTAAQSLVMLETILGPVQAALLALAIRRKFMR